jgi:hypothetical protein
MRFETASTKWGAFLLGGMLVFASSHGHAQRAPCEFEPEQRQKAPLGVRIAEAACAEYRDWYRPFIDLSGRAGWRDGDLAMEGEGASGRLSNGDEPWRRVAAYWKSTPVLAQLSARSINGASDCAGELKSWAQTSSCRAFVLDNPWSAAFVSSMMKKTGVRDFVFSASHMTYIVDAFEAAVDKPYRLMPPDREKPAIGDLLCYSRSERVRTHEDLLAFLRAGNRRLDSHCDIVVAANLNGDSKLYVIGGNVLHTVPMRKLNLNARGLFSPPKHREGECRLNKTDNCSLNQKYWFALLKLQR